MRFSSGEWSEEEIGSAFAILLDAFPRASLQEYVSAATLCIGTMPHGPIAALIDALRAQLQALQDAPASDVSLPKSARRARRSLVILPREVRIFRARPRTRSGRTSAGKKSPSEGELPSAFPLPPAAHVSPPGG